VQAGRFCCQSRYQAASRGHFECYERLLPHDPEGPQSQDLFPCLALALWKGNEVFVRRLLGEPRVDVSNFAIYGIREDEPGHLEYLIRAGLAKDLERLCRSAGRYNSLGCLSFLLEQGAPWTPYALLYACRDSRLDILEVVSKHSRDWCHHVPTVAGACGNVLFLMRAFAAGCPVWKCAQDGEPEINCLSFVLPSLYHPGENKWEKVKGWSLIVPSDLVCSGPVLLYAVQKGAPLTPRMRRMVGKVRARALALAGCFHRATRLSRAPGGARKWGAMARVPVEVIQGIATLARISIVAVDLVE
jgi:hypothetical protein